MNKTNPHLFLSSTQSDGVLTGGEVLRDQLHLIIAVFIHSFGSYYAQL